MKKITAIVISSVIMLALCCACSESSSDGAGDRATLGGISFEVPEGFELDNEILDNDLAEDSLYYIFTVNNQKYLYFEDWTYDEDNTIISELETKRELIVNNEVCGDVDIAYGTNVISIEDDAFHEGSKIYQNSIRCRFVIDDKQYEIRLESNHKSEDEREKNEEKDFDYESETIESILQSIEKTDQ